MINLCCKILFCKLYYICLTIFKNIKGCLMLSTVVSTKGQVILPSELRKKINIKKGMKFNIEIEGNKIILIPVNSEFFEKIAGSISEKGKLLKALISEKEKEKSL